MPPAAARPILTAVAAIVAAILGGCTGERVFFPHDFAYDRQVRALRLTEDEAYAIAKRGPKFSERPPHLAVRPPLIVAGWYGFTPIDKLDRSLRGYWVNGHTGEVEYRTASIRVGRGLLMEQRHHVYPSDWTSIEKISIPD
jgi:hypothetical protein